jgi:exoribonuclease-2
MKNLRHLQGALSLETLEAKPFFEGEQIRDLQIQRKNRAMDIIEDFMIATNGVTARFLAAKKSPSIRRIVRVPKRWDAIVALAKEYGFALPESPDSAALNKFLLQQQAADQIRFPDLSLVVIKLMGAGEYVAEQPGDTMPGHFGLAVKDYTHSTAPNRRYADLVSQRLLKATIAGLPAPYSYVQLDTLAKHLTKMEDAANKVERQVGKSAAALFLESRIGEQFDGIVTGASDKGTWARLLTLPAEGRVVDGFKGIDVGERVRLQLISVDIERGYIDFKRLGSSAL